MHESGDALGDSRGSSSAPRWWEPYLGPRDFHRASARRSLADCKSLLIKVVSGWAVASSSFTGPWVHTVMVCLIWFEADGFRSPSIRYGTRGCSCSGGSIFPAIPALGSIYGHFFWWWQGRSQ